MKIEISRKFYNELNYRKDIYTLIIILKSQIIAQMDIEYNANQYKEQGNQAYKSADYKKALSLYSKAIEINPKQSAFYLNRALCYYNMKNFQECIKQCIKSIDLNPQYIKAIKKKSNALVQLMKFQQALATLKQAYALEKNQATSNQIDQVEHYISNYNKYIEALKTEDYAQALSCVSYLVGKIADNKELKLIKIQCLAKTGATQQAMKDLKAIQHEKTPETMYLKGIIELYSGDSAKAKSYFSEGIRLDPQNLKCQKALTKANKCQKFKEQGNQLIKSSNWQAAEAKYTQALNLDPHNKRLNAIIYSNRALTFMKRKMWTKAAEDLNKSIELNSSYLKSYVKRAQVNMERGQFTEAIHDYAKIQELDPKIDLKTKIQEAKKKQKQAKKKDYYAILGIAKKASDEEIKKAYKKMALKYHPDRNRNKSEVEQDDASKKFRDINQAQDVLTNPQKRKLYDSGAMQYDGDTGADFSDFQGANMGQYGGMGGFGGNMGGNGQNFTFKMNGQDMGGMGGIDPNQIFSIFMGGMGGKGGFGSSGFGPNTRSRSSRKDPSSQSSGFGGFPFQNMGGFNSFGGNFGQKTKQQK